MRSAFCLCNTLPPAGTCPRTCHNSVHPCIGQHSHLHSISFHPLMYHSRFRYSRSHDSRFRYNISNYPHSHNNSRISHSYEDPSPGSRTEERERFAFPDSTCNQTHSYSHILRSSVRPPGSLHRSRYNKPAIRLRSVPRFHRSKKGQRRCCGTIRRYRSLPDRRRRYSDRHNIPWGWGIRSRNPHNFPHRAGYFCRCHHNQLVTGRTSSSAPIRPQYYTYPLCTGRMGILHHTCHSYSDLSSGWS